jgi:uncharacterized membrane protein
MAQQNDAGDKIVPNPLIKYRTEILILVIVAMQIVIALIAYPFLPARVPIHWNAAGQANNYANKWEASFLFPVISIVIWLLVVRQVLGPRLGRRGQLAGNTELRSLLGFGIVLFMLIMQLATTASQLGVPVDIGLIADLGLALLFIFLGNYMGKLRRNFWIGIRTPWTLTNEVVWERTHRFGGWLMVGAGLLMLPLSFVPAMRVWVIVPLLLIVVAVTAVYSYVCYWQVAEGKSDTGVTTGDGMDEG